MPSRIYAFMQDEFKRIRLSMGVSQQGLADLMGVTQATVSRWETGHLIPGARTMIALRSLQVSMLAAPDQAEAA